MSRKAKQLHTALIHIIDLQPSKLRSATTSECCKDKNIPANLTEHNRREGTANPPQKHHLALYLSLKRHIISRLRSAVFKLNVDDPIERS